MLPDLSVIRTSVRRLVPTGGAVFARPLFHSQVENVQIVRNTASNRHHSRGQMALVHLGKLSSSPLLCFVLYFVGELRVQPLRL